MLHTSLGFHKIDTLICSTLAVVCSQTLWHNISRSMSITMPYRLYEAMTAARILLVQLADQKKVGQH